MSAGIYNITIEQGATFQLPLALKHPNTLPFDLTGFTGRCQIRKTHDDSNVLAAPVVVIDTNPKTGKLTLNLTSTQTAALDFFIGYFDLELIDNVGAVTRLLQGKVILSKEITKI